MSARKVSREVMSMYCASWSGGKDSCLAAFRAIQAGKKISHLVHFDRPNNLHGVDPAMIMLHAQLTGIPMIQKPVDQRGFEQEFRKTVGDLASNGIRGMVFGDIYLEPHKEWVDRTCAELGIEPVEPLWGLKSESIIEDFLRAGFETMVASGNQKLIDQRFIGRPMNREFIDYLKANNLDVCGESGEFHTFVTKGPLFKGSIEVKKSSVTSRDGFWFLDVQEYTVKLNGKGSVT
jgi:diphthine-ammonia ligase